MEACPLSVWGRDRAVLPETSESIVGRLLHEAREVILREGAVGLNHSARAKAIISETKQSYESRLCSDADYAALVPLEQVYGRRKWIDREQMMLRWAANESLAVLPLGLTTAHPLEVTVQTTDPVQLQPDAFSAGLEQHWVCNELRLKGRPDQVQMNSQGVVEALDFKSGAVFDSQGKLAPAIETQLRLYMLMAEKLTGNNSRGVISTNSGSYDIRWTERDRKLLVERVLHFGASHPAGGEVEAPTIAIIGPQCFRCRIRPRCAKYLSEVPQKWKGLDEPLRLPYDTWGTVLDKRKEDTGWYLRIRDAAERTVVISGLAESHGIDEIYTGFIIFVFNAQPSEETYRHGSKLNPLSFHERAPGLNKNSAKQLRLFVGHPGT